MMFSSLVEARSVFIEDLTWTEVRDAIQNGTDTAIYYSGSTEQNGPHMAMGKHNFIARHVAGQIATKLGNALVYPVMPYAPTGDAFSKTGHMRFPGSVTVSESTFAAVAGHVAASARAAGFKKILLIADHGEGQSALAKLATDLNAQWKEEGMAVFHISDAYGRSAELEETFLNRLGHVAGGHAALADTSALMFLDKRRQWVRANRLSQAHGADGVDGDPRGASAAIGRRLIELKVASALAQIRRLVTAR